METAVQKRIENSVTNGLGYGTSSTGYEGTELGLQICLGRMNEKTALTSDSSNLEKQLLALEDLSRYLSNSESDYLSTAEVISSYLDGYMILLEIAEADEKQGPPTINEMIELGFLGLLLAGSES